MTRREMVKAAIGHQETERAPYCMTFTPDGEKRLQTLIGPRSAKDFVDNDVIQIWPPWWGWNDLGTEWREPEFPTSRERVTGVGSYEKFADTLKLLRDNSDKYILAMIYCSHFEKANSARSIENFLADMAGGVQALEFPCMDSIEPAFTVELKNVRAPVEILDVGAVFTSQPVEYRGEFSCSDEALNRTWKAARWAAQICMQTHHLDSPLRQEPLMDPGDYCIQSMVNHYAFAQPALTRQDIRKFAWILKNEGYKIFHLSYAFAWLQMLMDYYDYTGDQALVEEMAPYVHELLDTYTRWRGTNGLMSDAPNYMFMDWVNLGGFACHHPPAVIGQGYFTAFHYHGLEVGQRVASLTGDATRVGKYTKLRGEMAEAFNRELWNAEKGLYRDGKPFQSSVKPSKWLPEDRKIETFSPHVNLLAVLYDLAPKERQAAIVAKVLEEKPLNTQPWFYHWVFPAIDHAGLFDRFAVEQMHRWQVLPETQSFRERWGAGTASHGWCSTPLVQMSARILGVTPATPGFNTISLRPQLCGLTWAKGKVPTPLGDIAVSWVLSADKLMVDVTIPAGAVADVVLPVSHFENPIITLDDKKSAGVVRIERGQHHFEVMGQLKRNEK